MKLLRQRELVTAARSSFLLYALAMYRRFQQPKHIQKLIAMLEQIESGAIDRLAFSTPPRHGKTLLLELFCCWYLGRHPDRTTMYCTYGDARSFDVGRAVQRNLESPVHRAIFPESALATDVGSAGRLELQQGGAFFSLSRMGAITGRGADLLLIDDLLKDAAEAQSSAIRQQNEDFYQQVALTRLEPAAPVVLAGTRWHPSDLFGFVAQQEGEKPWVSLNFPALAETDDELGRAEGEPLWAERF